MNLMRLCGGLILMSVAFGTLGVEPWLLRLPSYVLWGGYCVIQSLKEAERAA